MSTGNPAFAHEFQGYEQVYGSAGVRTATVQGTVGKTFGLAGILSAAAIYTWSQAAANQIQPMVYIASIIGALVLAIVTIVKPKLSPWTAPFYALLEGVVLGAVSYTVEKQFRGYPGIALQAVSMTLGALIVMLFLYATRIIRVTNRLAMIIVGATGAIGLVYLVSFIAMFFGARVPFLTSASPLGIGFSVVVCGVAAFNLLLDFDFIERTAAAGAPKYMEWYGAFGLMVTLVWLYLEILRLLSKLSRDR
ncbi:MAG: Bax inhibitor-1/YccA family protein [Planctomycetota bacterium]|nr:Bax inhibitor-1/YccA family protein [Planctomycetota bacterium]